ncbi:MAG: sigma 54-dependent Fis family transcriptional regulator [Deltaproteobacteria bacterium]|nr:sigma 54-dependent Fis family transcriptional regulator [Deltaproteobacteria bacterium]
MKHEQTQSQPLSAMTVRRITVQVLDGPDKGLTVDGVGGRVAIGTFPDNEMRLTDPLVSRYHLELTASQGIGVHDLGSRNGTFIGDIRVQDAIVPPGTRIRVGANVLSAVDAEQVVVPQAKEATLPGVIIGSPAMRDVATKARVLAESNASVLIQGETGTGKDVLARAIHELGPRRKGPFVVVDAAALAPTLIASQLFGHERGAFTGADKRYEGAFEQANGGTVFLDEIGELPASVQPALLGVLERRKFRRLGGKEDVATDVRLVCATHRDLRAEANAGTFRADLYFRIAVARLFVPPLRERPEEIDALVEHFATEITGVPGQPFAEATLAALRAHRWTGNVRELRNVVESALAVGSVSLEPTTAHVVTADGDLGVSYKDARQAALNKFEQTFLAQLIKATNGNASAAARMAQMDRQYLLGLLRRHGFR